MKLTFFLIRYFIWIQRKLRLKRRKLVFYSTDLALRFSCPLLCFELWSNLVGRILINVLWLYQTTCNILCCIALLLILFLWLRLCYKVSLSYSIRKVRNKYPLGKEREESESVVLGNDILQKFYFTVSVNMSRLYMAWY